MRNMHSMAWPVLALIGWGAAFCNAGDQAKITGSELRLAGADGQQVRFLPMPGGGLEIVTSGGRFQIVMRKKNCGLILSRKNDDEGRFTVLLDSDGTLGMSLERKKHFVFAVRSTDVSTMAQVESPNGATVLLDTGGKGGGAAIMGGDAQKKSIFFLGRKRDGGGARFALRSRDGRWRLLSESDATGFGYFSVKSKAGGEALMKMSKKGTWLEVKRGEKTGCITIGSDSQSNPKVVTTDESGNKTVIFPKQK